MKMKFSLPVIFLTLCLLPQLTIEARAADAAADNVIGWVVPVRRKTFLVKSSQAGSQMLTLIPGRDSGQPLHGGDRVRCERGGSVKINIYGTVTEISGSEQWRDIPFLPPPNDSIRRAIAEYGHLGGRTRPGGQIILSPAKESRVSLDRLVFRWIPRRGNIFLSITSAATGEQLWEQTQIRGALGQLDSAEARNRLAAFRARGGTGMLNISLGGGSQGLHIVSFELLTTEEETRLAQELSVMDAETEANSILRHTGRAAIFDQYRMRAQVAEEYEAALALDRNNVHLLVNTAVAYEAIGDSRRVEQLTGRLPRGVRLPGTE